MIRDLVCLRFNTMQGDSMIHKAVAKSSKVEAVMEDAFMKTGIRFC
jgi:hypothetical protein